MKKYSNLIGKRVTVHSPATIANLVCGFDILGLALEKPFDIMTLEIVETKGIEIIHVDNFNLPVEAENNVAGVSLLALMQELIFEYGFKLIIEKQIKPGSGLGSSAASAAGVVVAANHLLGNIFSKEDLVRFAMNGEKLASGVKHADNISPCIFGGVTLIRSAFPLDIIPLKYPELFVTIVHPQIEVKTSDAREILRKEVLLKDAIKQWGNIAGLVAGLMSGDYRIIGNSLIDIIIEPVRSMLIPCFDEIKKRSLEAGALGGGISGSGPSVFMLSEKESIAHDVEQVIKKVYEGIGLSHYTYVTKINQQGVTIFEEL